MWKTLSIVAAALTAGAAFLSYSNIQQLKGERQLLEIAKGNLKAAEEHFKKADTQLAADKVGRKKTEGERDDLEKQIGVVKGKTDLLLKDIEAKKTELEEVTAKHTAAKKQIDDIGSIEEVKAKLVSLGQEKAAMEGQIADLKQKTTAAVNRSGSLNQTAVAMRTKEAWQAQGIIEDSFRAAIKSVDNTWGFVVVNAGNNRGVVSGATLDVVRGGSIIGQVKVTNVEQSFAVADVVGGSVAQGEALRPGDSVKVSQASSASQWRAGQAVQPAAGAAPAAPAGGKGADKPAGPAAPADPFADPSAPAEPAKPAAPAGDAPAPPADPFAN